MRGGHSMERSPRGGLLQQELFVNNLGNGHALCLHRGPRPLTENKESNRGRGMALFPPSYHPLVGWGLPRPPARLLRPGEAPREVAPSGTLWGDEQLLFPFSPYFRFR